MSDALRSSDTDIANFEAESVRIYTDNSATMDVLRFEALFRSLDPLDLQIINLLQSGASNSSIAKSLYISESTVNITSAR